MKKLDPSALDVHKARRLQHKSTSSFLNHSLHDISNRSSLCRGYTVHQPPETKIQSKEACSGVYERSSVTFPFKFSYRITLADVGAAPVTKRPNVQMPDEYLPPNKILFLQNLPETVTKDQLNALFSQHPNLHEVRLVPSKKDIAFVEYLDEGSATVAKDALHNYKLDGENKIKVKPVAQCTRSTVSSHFPRSPSPGNKIVGFEEIYLTTGLESRARRCKFISCTLSGASRMLVMQISIITVDAYFGFGSCSVVIYTCTVVSHQPFGASAFQRSSIPDHRLDLDLDLHEPQKHGSPPWARFLRCFASCSHKTQ